MYDEPWATQQEQQGIGRKVSSTGQDPGSYLGPARLAVYQDWFADRGRVSRKVDVHQAPEQSFVDYANTVLGAYRPADHRRIPD
jgi:hypothetical protein